MKNPTLLLTADLYMKFHRKCACGCQNITNTNKEYLSGHNTRGKTRSRITINKIKRFWENNPSLKKIWSKRSRRINTGKKLSKETKEKISIARKGTKFSEETKRKISMSVKKRFKLFSLEQRNRFKSFEGRKHTEETKRKMSLSASGENNHQWRGGSSFIPYSFIFNNDLKEQIRKRDNYICKNCKSKQQKRKLQVHHIDYDKQNNSLNNLISLCQPCHNKSSSDKNRKYWIDKCKKALKVSRCS